MPSAATATPSQIATGPRAGPTTRPTPSPKRAAAVLTGLPWSPPRGGTEPGLRSSMASESTRLGLLWSDGCGENPRPSIPWHGHGWPFPRPGRPATTSLTRSTRGFVVSMESPTTGRPEAGEAGVQQKIDTSVPHSARIWNYWLGGKDNFAVDREAGDQYRQVFPGSSTWRGPPGIPGPRDHVPGRRGGHPPVPRRRHRAADRRQHPRGRPAHRPGRADRLRRQRPAGAGARPRPADRHARGQRPPTSTPTCTTRTRSSPRPARRSTSPQPIGLILSGVMGHVPDYDEARAIIRRWWRRCRRGSYLSLNDGTEPISAGCSRRRTTTTTAARSPYTPALARRDRRLLRRPGAGRARRRAVPAVAAGRRGRHAGRHRRLRRGGPQALTLSRAAVGPGLSFLVAAPPHGTGRSAGLVSWRKDALHRHAGVRGGCGGVDRFGGPGGEVAKDLALLLG